MTRLFKRSKRRPLPVWLLLVGLLTPGTLQAQVPPNEDWRQVDSEHFVITSPSRLELLVERAAVSAERAYQLLSDRFVEAPDGRVQLLLTDHQDRANGFATPVPFNRITIFVKPPMDGGNISHFDDWLELVITHELVHTFHLELTGTIGKVTRTLFGRVPGAWPVFPSASTPTWVVEGLATYYESQLTGAGRVNGSWHDMAVRTATLENKFPLVDQASGSSPVWPHGNRPYVFGSTFLQHVSSRYGEDAIARLARALAGQWIPYRLNAAAHDAFEGSIANEWRTWTAQMAQEYEALAGELVDDAPITQGESVESAGRLAQQAVVSPDGALLAFTRSDGRDKTQIRIANLDGSEPRALTRINGVTTLSFTPDGDLVYPQLNFTDRYNLTSDLYQASPSGSVTRLTKGERLTYGSVSPDGSRIVAVREGGGSSQLVMVDRASGEVEAISGSSLDEHWAFPRWSPDGAWIAVARWKPPAFMDIVLVSPEGDRVLEVTRDRALDSYPTWTPDGAQIVWSSDRSGIPNLYAASVPSGSGLPAARQITNMLGGATHPSVDPSGSWIYYSSYHSDGWHIERVPYRPGEWFDPQPLHERFSREAPPSPELDIALTEARDYGAWQTLRPYYWAPLFAPAETALNEARDRQDVIKPAVGLQIAGVDLVGRHAFALSGQITTDGDRFIGGLSYAFNGLGNPGLGLTLFQSYDASSSSFNVQFQDSTTQEFFLVEKEQQATLSTQFLRRRFRSTTALTFSGGLIKETLSLQGLDGSEGPTLSRPRPERTFLQGRVTLSGANNQFRPFSFSGEDGFFGIVSSRVRREADLDSSLRGVLNEDRSFQEVVGEIGGFKAIGWPGFANHVLAFRVSGGAGFGPGANAFHFDVGGAEGRIEAFTGLGLFGGTPLLFPVRG
ncbi:MAG: TolB family protein, partial [Longimicrobiales bacterium]